MTEPPCHVCQKPSSITYDYSYMGDDTYNFCPKHEDQFHRRMSRTGELPVDVVYTLQQRWEAKHGKPAHPG